MTSSNEKGGLIKIPSVEDNDQVVSLAPQNGKLNDKQAEMI